MAVLTSNLLPPLPAPQFQSSSVFTICVVNLTVTPTAALHCFRSYYDKHLNDEMARRSGDFLVISVQPMDANWVQKYFWLMLAKHL